MEFNQRFIRILEVECKLFDPSKPEYLLSIHSIVIECKYNRERNGISNEISINIRTL
jgi:hypothetical protein